MKEERVEGGFGFSSFIYLMVGGGSVVHIKLSLRLLIYTFLSPCQALLPILTKYSRIFLPLHHHHHNP